MPAPAFRGNVSAFDDAALKTAIVTRLADGAMTQAALSQVLGLDEHAMGFALRRLSKAQVISPTWLDGDKAWRVTRKRVMKPESEAANPEPDEGPLDLEPDDDELEDGDQDEDDHDEELEAIPAPRPRPVYAPGHRQSRPASLPSTGVSPWINRPREGFSQAMSARAPEMSASKEARHVKGIAVDR